MDQRDESKKIIYGLERVFDPVFALLMEMVVVLIRDLFEAVGMPERKS